jgi:NifU-like N terminal domain
MNADLLEPRVRDLFANLHHAGAGATVADGGAEPPGGRVAEGEAGREQYGTRVRFMLRLAGSRLVEARYYAYGCPHTLATCEWLARRLEEDGREAIGGPDDWCRALGVPIVKLGRLLVVEDALRAAFERAEATSTAGS